MENNTVYIIEVNQEKKGGSIVFSVTLCGQRKYYQITETETGMYSFWENNSNLVAIKLIATGMADVDAELFTLLHPLPYSIDTPKNLREMMIAAKYWNQSAYLHC